jgi:hypothetical protein
MPESKKLSELISDLVLTYISRSKSENINDFEEKTFKVLTIKQRIDVYERTIDQKFEELRCVTPGPVRNLDEMLKELVDKKFEELRCECKKEECSLPKDWEEMVTLYAVKDYAVNKIEERMNEEKRWSYYTQVMIDRFYAEYKKFERYMTTKEWIKIAVAKIISTLKEYDANSKRDSKKSE